jgi:hypothetical protein
MANGLNEWCGVGVSRGARVLVAGNVVSGSQRGSFADIGHEPPLRVPQTLVQVKLPSFSNTYSEATVPHSLTPIMMRIDHLLMPSA